VRRFLDRAGTRTRYRNARGERALETLARVTRGALERAGVEPRDVEFLIYTGVARGWVEPATANVVQAELGLERATCFDILDGCAGWLRALHVARHFVTAGTYRVGLLVNCEVGVKPFQKWEFGPDEDIEPYLATFTIGEAATATVVARDDGGDDFYFRFANLGEYFDLCMVPLPTVEQFLPRSRPNGQVPDIFYARSEALMRIAVRAITEIYASDPRLHGRPYDIAFGHAASEKVGDVVCARLGIPRAIYFSTHRDYGNTITAAIPLGMSLAAEQGRLRRGDRVLIVSGASGITVGFAAFTY